MKKKNRIEILTKELLEILKSGNVTIAETSPSPNRLTFHPDFEKIVDIITTLDEEFKDVT